MLKVSGEALEGDVGFGIDPKVVAQFCYGHVLEIRGELKVCNAYGAPKATSKAHYATISLYQ